MTTDRDRCIGSGVCAFTAPDVFDVDGTGRVVVIGVADPDDDRVRHAIEGCPTNALGLRDSGVRGNGGNR